MADEQPKIIVDSDWKQEAQREKERLSEEVVPERGALPEASFLEIVNMLATQAAISLGGIRTPDGRELPANPELAAFYIDLLDILLQKSTAGLEATERSVLESTLHELRLIYVRTFGTRTPKDGDSPTP